MRSIIVAVVLVWGVGMASSCDEWVTPWAIVVDEQGHPIPKAKAICDVTDELLRERISDDQGKVVAPYVGGDVKCTISKDGYTSATTIFILRRERKLNDPEPIVLKKL